MRTDTYQDRDGRRVWLRDDEVDELLAAVDAPIKSVALLLAARSGLRRKEIIHVRPKDVVEGRSGHYLRVSEDGAKYGKFRETPIPERLATYVDAVAGTRDAGEDDPVVDVTGKTVYRWVRSAAGELEEATGDEAWSYLDVHDLRRTWGTRLLEQGVLPTVVMTWGGWDDWETFRKHYLGEFSPHALARERAKVDYLPGSTEDDVDEPRNYGVQPATEIHVE